jgi:hypothetical protein
MDRVFRVPCIRCLEDHTMNEKDGGPAFPGECYRAVPGLGLRQRKLTPGMSLRDWFAGQALAAIVSKAPFQEDGLEDDGIPEHTARGAYDYADAMLAAREVKP